MGYKDKELIVRKVTSSFIEKIFMYCGYDVNHDDYKAVVYAEKGYKTASEEKIKRYYDAYMYLLFNNKSPLTKGLLNRFFYLLFERIPEEQIVQKMVDEYFYLNEYSPIEKAIEYHLKVKKLLNSYEKLDQLIIPLMMLNYILIKEGIPSIKLVYANLVKYTQYQEDRNKLYLFLTEVIKNYEFISKEYMNNLEPLTVNEIISVLKADEAMLKEKYHIKCLILHGSYAKGTNRIDSDIDLIVRLDMDLLYDDRVKIISELKDYYTKRFNRFADIQEINMYLTDDFIKQAGKIKIIIGGRKGE